MAKDIDNTEEMENIVLVDDEGKEVEFVHLATIDYEDDWFIFVQPVELGDLEDDEMFIFKIESDSEGNDIFVPVEDEDLIEKVYAEFVKEYEHGCDCGCEDCDCEGECDGDCDCGCEDCDCDKD